jgi:acyl-CoA hydrolase
MQQQASSTEQVSKTVGSVAAVAGQNASSAQEVASAVDQQQIVVTTIDKSIEQLRTLLNDMRVLIGLKVEEISTLEEKTDLAPVEQESAPAPVSRPVRSEAKVEKTSAADEAVAAMKEEVESASKKVV